MIFITSFDIHSSGCDWLMALFVNWFTGFKSTLMIQKRDSPYKFRSLFGQHFQFFFAGIITFIHGFLYPATTTCNHDEAYINEISDILSFHLHAARALELFLQDLIDRTYEITLQSGAKTLNSFHL